MKLFISALNNHLRHIVRKYYFIDIDGRIVYASAHSGVKIGETVNIEEKKENAVVFTMSKDEANFCYVCIDEELPPQVKAAITVVIDETVMRLRNADFTMELNNQNTIWKNILYGNMSEYESALAREKYHLSEYKSYVLLFFKSKID